MIFFQIKLVKWINLGLCRKKNTIFQVLYRELHFFFIQIYNFDLESSDHILWMDPHPVPYLFIF